jgi:hypothetical protein
MTMIFFALFVFAMLCILGAIFTVMVSNVMEDVHQM